MNCIECFYATLERRRADRPASWLGIPDPEALPGLFSYLGVSDVKELKKRLDDDIYPVAGDSKLKRYETIRQCDPGTSRKVGRV